jgi:chromosomal replication initiator protein
MDIQQLWKNTCEELRITLAPAVFQTFVANSELQSLENTKATIVYQSSYLCDLAQKRYYFIFKEALDHQTKADNQLVFQVSSSLKTAPLDSTPLFSYQKQTSPTLSGVKAGLHPKYTFDNLIVGNSNNFAYAASQGIVKNPGLSYNPFFIWGGVGVGKTHLMQAIGHELLKNNPDLKVKYFPAETFGNELIASLKSKNIQSFKEKYRSLDCILVDDIQFIAGKEYIQEEFFHTFNSLHLAGKQVILTSDRPPKDIKNLEDRLVSRFMGGLTVDIQIPDFEMRCAIIIQKGIEKGTVFDSDAVSFLSEKFPTNTRDLEGKVQEVVIQAQAQHLPTISLDFIENLYQNNSNSNSSFNHEKLTPRHLISVCAHHFNLKTSELCGSSRKKELVTARHLTAFLLLTETNLPLEEVGQLLGGRDHTSIMHARDKVQKDINTNPQTRNLISLIKSSF